MRFANFTDNVRGGIPAGIRIHHEHEADGEWRANNLRQVSPAGGERNRLSASEYKTSDQKSYDQHQLEHRPDVLECAARTNPAQVYERDKPGDREAQYKRRNSRDDSFEIFAKRHGGECNRCGEPDRGGDPAREKSKRWMIGAREKIVLAARARKHSSKLAVAERPAQRGDSPHDPKQQ